MQKFIDQIKAKHQNEKKFIDEIAIILDLKYDAAYRRINGMSKLSLEESLILAKHYRISLDNLIEIDEKDLIFMKKNHSLKNIDEIADYLENSYNMFVPFFKDKNSTVIFSSKDIPIFYTLGNSTLSRFKMYCWIWMLDPKFSALKLKFSDFSMPEKLTNSAEKLSVLYQSLNVVEFWNETILNSVLYQLNYFLEFNIISKYELNQILGDLKMLLSELENKLQNPLTKNYSLYLNEILLMNNSIVFYGKKMKTMLVPLNILGYIEIKNEIIIDEQINFYEFQKQNSIALSEGNQKQRTLFFNLLYEKIENFNQEIQK